MIHSMSGGVITSYDKLTYLFVQIDGGIEQGVKRWYISPFIKNSVGDKVEVPTADISALGTVLKVEVVTAQTAPYPVKRTREILRIL